VLVLVLFVAPQPIPSCHTDSECAAFAANGNPTITGE
jgi:hypothetical protein